MTMIIDGTNGLTFNNSTTQASAGTVLQVVQGTYSTATTTTSGSFVAVGLNVSITPKFSTSKILLFVNGICRTPANGWAQFAIYRNGSSIYNIVSGFNYNSSTITSSQLASVYLDSPSTTSSTTYALYFNSQGTTGAQWTPDNTMTTFTALEVTA